MLVLMSAVSSQDFERLLSHLGEVNELASDGRLTDALTHAVAGAARMLHAPALWWSIVRAEHGSFVVEVSRMYGLDDWQVRYWQQWFLTEEAYARHPTWEPFFAAAGRARTFIRAELIADEVWAAHAYRELSAQLGYDDSLASAVPLGRGRECMLVPSRALDDGRFGERERTLLHHLNTSLTWLHQRVRAAARGPRFEEVARLSPRQRTILEQLLTPHSEKEMAALLGLSPRSVHKYVEQVYRHFEVSSRAELMAAWCDSSDREAER